MDVLIKHLGPYPCAAPLGFSWVPNGWKLVPTNQPKTAEKSFEELFLDKVKGSTSKTKKPKQKLDLRAKVYFFLAYVQYLFCQDKGTINKEEYATF